ncbi:MAG: MBL fold metallo-hydrolase, partial [Flavobacteriales bacterium]|nr:MBL fold metallo-hydrolase [Flavobacteriales bacterium]
TYILYDESGKCVVVDPGNSNPHENQTLLEAVQHHCLKPQAIWLTHGHADHVCGNAFVAHRWGIPIAIHPLDQPLLREAPFFASLFGFRMEASPEPSQFFDHGTTLSFGQSTLEVRHIPGHAPGHVVFVHHPSRQVIGGDVLFLESIGRTDLPGGDFETLANGIRKHLYTLPDDYTVWPGHGPSTTIGHEKKFNPFVRESS